MPRHAAVAVLTPVGGAFSSDIWRNLNLVHKNCLNHKKIAILLRIASKWALIPGSVRNGRGAGAGASASASYSVPRIKLSPVRLNLIKFTKIGVSRYANATVLLLRLNVP
jgi:hypothetical protein